MADDLSALGDLIVQVGADISPLQDALNQIPQAAQTAADEFDQFMAAGAAGSDAVTSSVQNVTASINDAAAAAGAATAPTEELANSLADVGTQANSATGSIGAARASISDLVPTSQQAGESMGQLGMQMFGLYAAVSIFQQIKDALLGFAEEAVTAFGQIQKASISLTALSGSADQTAQSISMLRNLANQEGLDFPQLLTADQRMTALGFDAQQIPGALRAIADAAAATNTPFANVASSFDRIAESGAVMPRTLATLGLSINDIAKAMGVASDQAQAMFKTLDQSERLTVLEEAFNKYAGVAELAATGVLGQWQQVKNALTQLMEDIGAAIAPAASAFLSFLRDDVIPWVTKAVDAFRSLPVPVQEAMIGVTAFAAVVAPLVLSLTLMTSVIMRAVESIGLLVQAVGGMSTLATIGTVLAGVGIAVTAAIVLWTQLRDIWVDLQELIPNLGSNIESIVGPAKDVFLQITGLQGAFAALTDSLRNFQAAFSAMAPAILNIATGPFGALKQVLNDTLLLMGKIPDMSNQVALAVTKETTAVDQYNRSMATAALAVQQGTMGLGAYAAAHDKAMQSLMMLDAAEIKHATDLRGVSDSYTQLKNALDDARQHLATVQEAYNAGTASAGQLAAAQKDLEKAQVALNPDFLTAAQYQKMLDQAQKDLESSSKSLAAAFNGDVKPAVEDVATAQANLAAAQQKQNQAAIALALAQAQLNGVLLQGKPSVSDLNAATENLSTAEKNLDDATNQVNLRQKDLQASQKASETTLKAVEAAAKSYNEALLALNPTQKTAQETTAAVDVARAKLQSDTELLLSVERTYLALPVAEQGNKESQAYKDLDAATKAVADDKKNLTQASADLQKAQQLELSTQQLMLTVNRDFDTLQKDHIIPNTTSLQQAVDNLRSAKQNLLSVYQQELAAQQRVNDLDVDGKQGTQEYTSAVDALKSAHANLSDAEKSVTDAQNTLTTNFKAGKDAVDAVTASTNTAVQANQDLNVAYSVLGKQVPETLNQVAAAADQAFQLINASGQANYKQLLDAQVADLQAQQKAMEAQGMTLRDDQRALLNDLLAQQELWNIENIQLVQNWAGAWVDSIKQIDQAITKDLGQAFTDLITNIGNVGADFKKLGDDIVSIIVNHIIAEAIKPLLASLDQMLGNILGISSAMTSTMTPAINAAQQATQALGGAAQAVSGDFGDIANVASSALTPAIDATSQATDALSGAAGALSEDVTNLGQGVSQLSSDLGGAGSLGSSLGSLAGSISGMVSMITGVVSAITGIASLLVDMHSQDILKQIELNTRQTFNVLQYSIFHDLEVYFPYLFDLYALTGQVIAPSLRSMLAAVENETTAVGRSENLLNEIKDDLDKMVRGVNVTGNVSTGQAEDLVTMKEQLLGIWAGINEIKADTHDKIMPAILDMDLNIGKALESLQIVAAWAVGGQLGAQEQAAQEQAVALEAAAKAAQAQSDALAKLVEQTTQQLANAKAAAQHALATSEADKAAAQKATDAANAAQQAFTNAAQNAAEKDAIAQSLQAQVALAYAQYQQTGSPADLQVYQQLMQQYTSALKAYQTAEAQAQQAKQQADSLATAAQNAQSEYLKAQQAAQTAQQQATTLSQQLTSQITAAANAQTAATNAQNAAAQAEALVAQLLSEIKAGGPGTISGGGGSGSSIALASFITANFQTLYTYLQGAFRPLLTPIGGQGVLTPPTLPTFGGSGIPGSPSSNTQTLSITNHFNGPFYGGPNAMDAFTKQMADNLIRQFRTAGMKF